MTCFVTENLFSKYSSRFDRPCNPEELRFTCTNQCGKEYMSEGALARHLRYECGQDPKFTCPFCNYKFKHNFLLIRHISRTHNMGSNSNT